MRRLLAWARTRSARSPDDERGAVLLIGAAGVAVVLVVAALVVDLGSARADRAANQIITDASAAAGVVGLVEAGSAGGCEAARGYLEAHLGTVAGLSCGGFPVDCDDSTASVTTAGTVDDIAVTIRHPVDDSDPLMRPGSNSAQPQSVTDDDGDRCDRIAVWIDEPSSRFFGAVTNTVVGSTAAHSVARISDEYGRALVINLLMLERTECEVLSVGGGGSSGGITVSSVTDPDTGTVYPGRIALDSDGTGSTCASVGTIHTNGSGATIRADGVSGCADELVSGTGQGCGRLETYAPGSPGCNLPACSAGGVIAPPPTKSPRRLTRAPIDWQYNCRSAYPAAYDIRRCSDAGSRSAYIDDLVFAVNTFNSFQSYRDAGYPCQINGSGTAVVVPEGNWRVDCSDLRVGRELTFEGGNIIFEGDVTLLSNAVVRINKNNTATYTWAPGSTVDYREHSSLAAFVYLEGGSFSKSAGASLEMSNTMMYVSAGSDVSFGGGSGSMVWTAPRQGPFTNLALWSESSVDHKFAGSAGLTLEGIFFTPTAKIVYTGNGGQATVEAQFIALGVSAQGNGSLRVAPKWNRAIKHPPPGISELIR